MKNKRRSNKAKSKAKEKALFKLEGTPKIVSIDPGKSIILKFEKPKSDSKEDQIEVKWKKNIFNSSTIKDIKIENLDDKPQKEPSPSEVVANPQPPNANLINCFSSVGEDQRQEPFNLNWGVQNESQDINAVNNYLKPEGTEGKFINLDQSHISQIMESVEGWSDFYMSRPLLSVSNDQMKSYHMGGPSILNQFCNNATPVFSINEEMGEPIRPNITESDAWNDNLEVQNNLPPFVINPDGEITLTEDFKPPIDTHNQ